APKNSRAAEVSAPRRRKVILQKDLPHRQMRSNSLEICGNVMAVAYQTAIVGTTPAGIELFDIAEPEQPRSVGFFDCSGPHSRGVHQGWFVDGETIHCSGGAAGFQPRNPRADQPYRNIARGNPA